MSLATNAVSSCWGGGSGVVAGGSNSKANMKNTAHPAFSIVLIVSLCRSRRSHPAMMKVHVSSLALYLCSLASRCTRRHSDGSIDTIVGFRFSVMSIYLLVIIAAKNVFI